MPSGIRKERKSLESGMIFTKVYKGKKYTLKVLEHDGKIKYKVGDDLFNSPTAAARSVRNDTASVNGWVFWRMKNY